VDLHSQVASCRTRLDDVVAFAERSLAHGSPAEILVLKRAIMSQIRTLVSSTPQLDALDLNMRFVGDAARFERALADSFGRFFTAKELKESYLNTLTNASMHQTSGLGEEKLAVSVAPQQHQAMAHQPTPPPPALNAHNSKLFNIQQLQQQLHHFGSS
jgi:hypothetical protein